MEVSFSSRKTLTNIPDYVIFGIKFNSRVNGRLLKIDMEIPICLLRGEWYSTENKEELGLKDTTQGWITPNGSRIYESWRGLTIEVKKGHYEACFVYKASLVYEGPEIIFYVRKVKLYIYYFIFEETFTREATTVTIYKSSDTSYYSTRIAKDTIAVHVTPGNTTLSFDPKLTRIGIILNAGGYAK